jgi:hypothetical protein
MVNVYSLVQTSLSRLNCQVRADDLEFLSKPIKTKSQAISNRRHQNI